MEEIKLDPELELQIVATGAHLSPEFGLTYRQIEADGFQISSKVEMLLSADTATAIAKSTGLGVIGFADAFSNLKPDFVVLLGDRYEILAAAQTAMLMQIPIAHIHGGEVTEGAVDESIRHAISKMSHIHFAAAEVYRKRIIQLGESPSSVFNFGTPGLEILQRINLPSKSEWISETGFEFGESNFIVTFHPETIGSQSAETQFSALLLALEKFLPMATIVFTRPNADEGGRVINRLIDEFVNQNPGKAIAFGTLGQRLYFAAISHSQVVIGNSSSGVIEAPFLGIPTVNIGTRQSGRLFASSVFTCEINIEAIQQAIIKAIEFKKNKFEIKTHYNCSSKVSVAIKEQLKIALKSEVLRKKFHDVEFSLPLP